MRPNVCTFCFCRLFEPGDLPTLWQCISCGVLWRVAPVLRPAAIPVENGEPIIFLDTDEECAFDIRAAANDMEVSLG